jgi:hypothetical protein
MRAERRLGNRKGVFVVLFGILFMALMAAAAVSIDFARIWAMRNELQTAADAAALAGAVQISMKTENTDFKIDSATKNFGARNKAMGAATVVDSVVIGNWEDNPVGSAPNWTPICRWVGGSGGSCVVIGSPAAGLSKNGVRTVVSHTTNNLIMSAFNITVPNVHARATSWADAPISVDNCIKPWAIPYAELMYRINLYRNITPANSDANLTRAFDQNLDMSALKSMTETQRTFDLKLAGGTTIKDSLPGSGYPGNYQAVKLPIYKESATSTQEWPNGDPGNGGQDYRDNIAGVTCNSLAVGNLLQVKTGAMTGPTIQGVEDGVCGINSGGLPANGDCIAPDGTTVGVAIKAAFHACISGRCNGSTGITEVKLLGSFTLTKVYDKNDNKASPPIDMGQIRGYFNPVQSPGPVGTVGSTQVKIILVK